MTDLKAKLARLRASFVGELPRHIEALTEAWEQDRIEGGAVQTHFLAHRLAGSAATFEFPELAQEARELEHFLQPASGGHELPPGSASEVAARLGTLRRLALAAASGTPAVAAEKAPEPLPLSRRPRVAFAPAAPGDEDLLRELEGLGYPMVPPGSPEAEACLLDVEAAEPDAAPPGLPRIFLSGRGDMAARLQAIRAGGHAFFQRPVQAPLLADRLDALCARQPADPYRILVVDDDPEVTAHLALLLQDAGMLARGLSDPLGILDALADLRPDLLLLDMHMPACSGKEIAAVIRQMESLAGLPVVFLSGEQDFDRQMDAMGPGADDFLTKPIAPDRLVALVTHRAWRGRQLQGLMTRDSLTGLLNHSALLDRLEAEVARASRLDSPLVFAMTDLDHFKRVNDTHGHGAGDQVLKAFARLLQQRLRRSDAVGRYGGEEFGLVLPDTDATEARTLLDALRADFGSLRFRGAGGDFQATFSAGLATLSGRFRALEVCEAADQALYAAKAAGRNRVELAPDPGPIC